MFNIPIHNFCRIKTHRVESPRLCTANCHSLGLNKMVNTTNSQCLDGCPSTCPLLTNPSRFALASKEFNCDANFRYREFILIFVAMSHIWNITHFSVAKTWINFHWAVWINYVLVAGAISRVPSVSPQGSLSFSPQRPLSVSPQGSLSVLHQGSLSVSHQGSLSVSPQGSLCLMHTVKSHIMMGCISNTK